MAAYAAAVSLMHIIDLIKNHPSPPISLDRQQLHSLTEIVTFLQEFLESYVSPFSYSDEADPLEMRIAEAVYAAEDVIEFYIVDNIHRATATERDDDDVDSIQLATAAAQDEDEQIRYFNFYQGLQKVIEAMDMIKKEAMDMEMVRENKFGRLEAELHRNVSFHHGTESSSNIESEIEMVGFDDVRLQLLDRLVGGDSNRHIIPIVGMGGIGKTTLARNVFADKLIKEHFDICMWATISQDHNIEQTLSKILFQGKGNSGVAGLGEELHKRLFGRRYLIVLDDMWSIEVWDKIRNFFPECSQRSRIIVTTRMSNLAAHLTNSSNSLCLSFLNGVDSWNLFSKTVFGDEESFPDHEQEFREIGEKIVAKCKGLPLSITVIGGLLARSQQTKEYWEYIEGNLSSTVNLENEEYCLRVLKLSYNHLPAYLKPCFLYMGVFDEDRDIEVSTLTNLWVSEGFVQPRKKKSLETIAREYFQELVDRNLVLAYDEEVSRWHWNLMERELGSVGMTKLCRMHDLVRDLSLREAQKQRFYYVYNKLHNPPPQDTSSHSRRIVIPYKTEEAYDLECSPYTRSYVCHDPCIQRFLDFRLLRTLHATYRGVPFSNREYTQKDMFGLVNARLLAFAIKQERGSNVLYSSINRLWSLHTLLVNSYVDLVGPVEFWNMHQLKHVEFTVGRLCLNPPSKNNNNNIVILENLHTLIGMKDFYLNEDVVKRIPNLTIFDVSYDKKYVNQEVHCLSYLQRLSKLESFRCFIKEESGENLQRICFPHSLNQILLLDDYVYLKWNGELEEKSPQIEWEDVLQKIGRLPFLEELVMEGGFFRSRNWETSEGQFPRLRKLELKSCESLENWTVSESSHFPRLQKLILDSLDVLEEIPSEIGEIASLKSIKLRGCSKSAVLSAKKIVEEQEDLHGEEQLSFRVLVACSDSDTELALASLATPNFQLKPYLFF